MAFPTSRRAGKHCAYSAQLWLLLAALFSALFSSLWLVLWPLPGADSSASDCSCVHFGGGNHANSNKASADKSGQSAGKLGTVGASSLTLVLSMFPLVGKLLMLLLPLLPTRLQWFLPTRKQRGKASTVAPGTKVRVANKALPPH